MKKRSVFLAAALSLCLSALPLTTAHAQTGSNTTQTEHHGGSNIGWLGLLGLIGLFGMRRTTDHVGRTSTAGAR